MLLVVVVAGVLNIVHGLGAEAGQALVAHPDVPLISFTGGTSTGKIVAATAAPLFKKVSLELGASAVSCHTAGAAPGAPCMALA